MGVNPASMIALRTRSISSDSPVLTKRTFLFLRLTSTWATSGNPDNSAWSPSTQNEQVIPCIFTSTVSAFTDASGKNRTRIINIIFISMYPLIAKPTKQMHKLRQNEAGRRPDHPHQNRQVPDSLVPPPRSFTLAGKRRFHRTLVWAKKYKPASQYKQHGRAAEHQTGVL